MRFHSVPASQGKTPLYEKKMTAVIKPNRAKVYLREKLQKQARKQHFCSADTE
jgi:hypothetical protein